MKKGLIFHMNQEIPCKTINAFSFPKSLKVWPLEINLINKKIFAIAYYKPRSLNDEYFLDQLHGALSVYSITYDNFHLLGHFNISRDEERVKEFCNNKTLICYIGTNPSYIGHAITNMISFFMKSCISETRISDHHKLIMFICRTTFVKGKSKELFRRCYQNFDSKHF